LGDKIPVVFDGQTGIKKVTQNFVNHILYGEALISPAEDGIYGLSISNAIHLSSWTESWVTLPIDEDKFLEELTKRVEGSKKKRSKNKF
jgi:hypothetical protein